MYGAAVFFGEGSRGLVHGAIVAFEVEFVKDEEETLAMETLHPHEVEPLWIERPERIKPAFGWDQATARPYLLDRSMFA